MKKILTVLPTFLIVFFFLVMEIQAKDFPKGFSLKFTGGYGTMLIGDINVVLEDQENSYSDWASLPDATKEGEFKKLNRGFEYEGELIISLTEHFGIGIGAGYIQRAEPSKIAFELDTSVLYLNYDISYSPELSAIPIKLSIYYYFPIVSRMNLFLNGGIGYYFGKLNYRSVWDMHMVYEGWDSSDVRLDSIIETKDNGIGFHGGIGFEYDVMKNLAFFVEGAGRYIKLKDWEGDSIEYIGVTYDDGTTEGTTETSSGTLWYYEVVLKIQEEKPNGSNIRNVRKAEVDFSGFSFRIGLRVKF
jgi:opacity protein-like surface antigen